MTQFEKMFFLVIAISLCSISTLTVKAVTLPCELPTCAVTPLVYNNVFAGTMKVLYFLSTANPQTVRPQDCFYVQYGPLSANHATANFMSLGRNGEQYTQHNSTVLLTVNGLTLQTYLELNLPLYETGSINPVGVITINDCTRDLFYVGCHVNNCGPAVVASAKIAAQSIASLQLTPKLHLTTVNFTQCTNTPTSTA